MMREKHRYILVEASSQLDADEKRFATSLQRELLRCVGELSYHTINPKFVKFEEGQRFVLKSSLEGAEKLVLALAMVKRIDSTEMGLYTLRSSGTIRALEAWLEGVK